MSNDADTTMQQDSWFFSEKNDTRLQFDSGPIAYFWIVHLQKHVTIW